MELGIAGPSLPTNIEVKIMVEEDCLPREVASTSMIVGRSLPKWPYFTMMLCVAKAEGCKRLVTQPSRSSNQEHPQGALHPFCLHLSSAIFNAWLSSLSHSSSVWSSLMTNTNPFFIELKEICGEMLLDD